VVERWQPADEVRIERTGASGQVRPPSASKAVTIAPEFFGAGRRRGVPDIAFGCVPMPAVIFAYYQPATLERLKMDKDELRLDVAEALGKATALICLQTALVAALKAKGVLTDSEVATLSGVANETLVAMEGVRPLASRDVNRAGCRDHSSRPRRQRRMDRFHRVRIVQADSVALLSPHCGDVALKRLKRHRKAGRRPRFVVDLGANVRPVNKAKLQYRRAQS
jgi:hypothetical protein